MWPVNGSCFNVCSACAASVVNPRRMSVTPAASQPRVLAGTGITPTNPDQSRQRLGIVGAQDPQPVPAGNVDLDRAERGPRMPPPPDAPRFPQSIDDLYR